MIRYFVIERLGIRWMAVTLIWLVAVSAGVAETTGNHYRNENAGFEFSKPDSWSFGTQEFISENQKHLRLKEKEWEERLREAKGPLVSAHKFPTLRGGVNPIFQVSVLALDDWINKTPQEMVKELIAMLESNKAAFEELTYVDNLRDTTIGGHPGARAGVTLVRGVSDGSSFRVRTDIVVVPQGEFMFLIGLSREPADADTGRELESILATFAFVE